MRRCFFPIFAILLAAFAAALQARYAAIPDHTALGYAELWKSNYPAAGVELTEALREDAASPERWSDLAEFHLQAGNPIQARNYALQAVHAAPGLPHIRMRAANVALRRGSTTDAIAFSRDALERSPEYSDLVFQLWARSGRSVDDIFRLGVHENAAFGRGFVRYLIAAGRQDDVLRAWPHIDAVLPGDESLIQDAVGLLMETNRLREALRLGGPLTSDQNLIFHGEFAGEISGKGLDWHHEATSGVETMREPDGSMHLRFTGERNPDFHGITQMRPLLRGQYRLWAKVKTKKLTSNEGFHFRVIIPGTNPMAVAGKTDSLKGDHDWTELSTAFVITGPVSKVEIQMARVPSMGMDESISGDVWVRSVGLTKLLQVQ